jgi:prepilin signal peptidase PulO-like enzyme (type II secretory pathway)
MFVGVLVLRLSAGTAVDAYSMLYALPIALLATALGVRAGAVAGVVAVGLTVVWAVTQDVSLSPTGWASRIVPMLLLGVLLGDASDRVQRSEEERLQLEAAALLHRQAIEINDSLVQGMAAAKWALEAGDATNASALLDQTIAQAHALVSELIRQAGMGGHTESLSGVPEKPGQL